MAFIRPIEPTKGLLVDHDHAELCYDREVYRLTQRRRLTNNGDRPITRYLIRISVDRYPGDLDRSNRLYRDNPLTWEEIDLRAWQGDDRAESMRWSVQHDRDAFKEIGCTSQARAAASHSTPATAPGSNTHIP